MDILTTLLWLGETGWLRLLAERKAAYGLLKGGLEGLAGRLGLKLLATPANPISLGLAFPPEVLPPAKVCLPTGIPWALLS